MGPNVEVVVVGAGVMGACAAWRLAARGRDVHVLEQFEGGHSHGSSHGTARIFRLAYPEADYVGLAQAALPLWNELEEVSGVTLRSRVGELDHGDPADIHAIAANLGAVGLPHELLTPADVEARWPGLRCDRGAVFHPDGGTVHAAATVLAALDTASAMGATVHEHRAVDHIENRGDHAIVHSAEGSVTARHVVVTAGGWVGAVLARTGVALPPMVVTREQPVHYERVAGRGVDTGSRGEPWPSFIHWSEAGPPKTSGVDENVWGYGLPTPDGRIKMGEHHAGEVVARIGVGNEDATEGSRPPIDDRATVDVGRLERLRVYARAWLPGVDPESADPERCLYTSTASTDFIIDRVGPIVVAAGFSGHGFKFAPQIGDLLADMVDGSRHAPPRFALTR